MRQSLQQQSILPVADHTGRTSSSEIAFLNCHNEPASVFLLPTVPQGSRSKLSVHPKVHLPKNCRSCAPPRAQCERRLDSKNRDQEVIRHRRRRAYRQLAPLTVQLRVSFSRESQELSVSCDVFRVVLRVASVVGVVEMCVRVGGQSTCLADLDVLV